MLEFCDRYLARKANVSPTRYRRRTSGHRSTRSAWSSCWTSCDGPRFGLADTWHADRLEVLRLLLYATRTGLFELRWELMCPNCRVPKQEVDSLAQLPVRFHCEICGISYGANFDASVELRFSIHPTIRTATDRIYCIGGPLRMPHIAAQQYLRPREERGIAITPAEPLHLRTVGSDRRLNIVSGPPNPRLPEVKVTYADGCWVAPHSLMEADTLELPGGSSLSLRNHTGSPVLAVLEDATWTRDATTAAQVTAFQEFRDLFSSEMLVPGQEHTIRHIALVFSDLKGSTRLYEGIGDAAAYSRVNRHFDFIRQAVTRMDGSVVKTLGDGVMCVFGQLDDALEAAIAMQEHVITWCQTEDIDPPLVLKLGVHAGPVIAMTANDRLDYFGRTVNIAARLGDQSQGNDVVLLRDVFERASDRVTASRSRVAVEAFTTRLRGLESEQQLIRIHPGRERYLSGPDSAPE